MDDGGVLHASNEQVVYLGGIERFQAPFGLQATGGYNYFYIDGKRVQSRTDSNLVGIELDDLRAVSWSVLVAGGAAKVEPMLGGLHGGYFNTLVTDDETADALLAISGRGEE